MQGSLEFSLAFPPAKLRNLEKRRARARAPLLDFSDNCFFYAISRKLRGSEVCVKQDHFTQGSCSTPGSTRFPIKFILRFSVKFIYDFQLKLYKGFQLNLYKDVKLKVHDEF